MNVEIPVYHHPDGSRTIGQPDPRHGVRLGRIAMALNGLKTQPVERGRISYALSGASSEWRTKRPCDCLSCQTGRPDYPCLIEEDDA